MTSFLQVLSKPQFANLKSLSLIPKIKIGKKLITQISQCCPNLQEINVGFPEANAWTRVFPTNHTMIKIAETIPNLTTIGFSMWSVTNIGIRGMVHKFVGSNILCLRIHGTNPNYLSDTTIKQVAASCVNLKEFTYNVHQFSYNPTKDYLSESGIITLVTNCRQLEQLTLDGTKNVGIDAYETILSLSNRPDTRNNKRLRLKKICVTQGAVYLFMSQRGVAICRQLSELIDDAFMPAF